MQPKTITLDIEKHNVFFTSDQHFMHYNVIEFCNRPFDDLNHMHKTMIDNWNQVVNFEDHVFMLGDFCFGDKAQWLYFLERLNGNIYLVYGNHDKSIAGNFVREAHMMNLFIIDPEVKGGQRISLCHYPMLSWYQSHNGAWMLYGHLHGKLVNTDLGDGDYDIRDKITPYHVDVGVDLHNFYPVSYHQVKAIINAKKLKQ